ncbi:MAG: acetyl-CoA C-acetyltransferase [Deltaproteobacteria bacterium]|jgi:acetyl-CoA C-acetyltransferase|nr:acetyl-CoA C-acetyltransferase [Deltaproteobacteria bacterium]MBW2532437.1 acetyl-CoA C-acetyltransferase [Deltaproteobacteria bacterium]
MGEAYIFEAVRTPRGLGKDKGSLYTVRPTDLLVTVLKALQQRTNLDTREVEDIMIGCVTQTGEQGTCIARFAALEAGYHFQAPGCTVNRFCASGLQTVNQAAALIKAGCADLVVAGGVESMSRVKMGSDGGAMFDAQAQWKIGSVPQGISADLLAALRGFTREDVDEFAVESQKRAVAARDAGKFDKSVVPVVDDSGMTILARDEYPRPDTTLEGLSKLRPSFEMMGRQFGLDALTRKVYPEVERIEHIHTAGNSSGIVDGAAAMLIGSKEKGEALGLKPRARIVCGVSTGEEPLLMLTGPLPATRLVLKKAGMTIDDIDLFEVNEAFAAVTLTYLQEFDLDHAKVNINGGAIALGHPLGATGNVILGTALDLLEERNLTTALTTLCIGGGMGTATIIERV